MQEANQRFETKGQRSVSPVEKSNSSFAIAGRILAAAETVSDFRNNSMKVRKLRQELGHRAASMLLKRETYRRNHVALKKLWDHFARRQMYMCYHRL
jgi:hypothetical protein